MINSVNVSIEPFLVDTPEMAQLHLMFCTFETHRQFTLPITPLKNSVEQGLYLNEQSKTYSIFHIDPLTAFLDRDEFKRYVKRLSEIMYAQASMARHSKGLQVFDNFIHPYFAQYSSFDEYETELYYRTELVCNIVKENNPKAVLISPSIQCYLFNDFKKSYLDFLLYKRNKFDCYGFQYCGDLSEPDVGCITTILAETRNFAQKEMWFTKFRVASCQHGLNDNRLGKPVVLPNNIMIGHRLINFYNNVKSINPGVFIFFDGLFQEKYSDLDEVPDEYPPIAPVEPEIRTKMLAHKYFSGIMSKSGEVKTTVINALEKIAKENVITSRFTI